MSFRPLLFQFCLLLFSGSVCAQSPIAISYETPGNYDASGGRSLQPSSQSILNIKECVIDFHYSAPSARVIMEGLNSSTIYFYRVIPLEVNAFSDSTYVYGKLGAWTIGVGRYEGIDEFRVRVLSPNALGANAASVAAGVYP